MFSLRCALIYDISNIVNKNKNNSCIDNIVRTQIILMAKLRKINRLSSFHKCINNRII